MTRFPRALRAAFTAAAAVLAAAAVAACGDAATPDRAASTATADARVGATIVAAGLIEPAGEERVLIPEAGGRLDRVLISVGDQVKAGQLIAELDNRSERAAVDLARAELARAEAERDRLRAGPRPEERAEAAALAAEARALAAQAASDYARRERLANSGQLGREALDQAKTASIAARARAHAAEARAALLRAGTRSEDLRAGEAAVAAATARIAVADAALARTRIASPIDGVVLERELAEGETVVALAPIPLARIGDTSTLYARLDIDEFDVGRVAVGMRATVTSDAFPGRTFSGDVVRVGTRMGRRRALSESPTERVDATVLEALVRLEAGAPLPVGLRVDARLERAAPSPE